MSYELKEMKWKKSCSWKKFLITKIKYFGGKIIIFFYSNNEKNLFQTDSHCFGSAEMLLDSVYRIKNDDNCCAQIFLEKRRCVEMKMKEKKTGCMKVKIDESVWKDFEKSIWRISIPHVNNSTKSNNNNIYWFFFVP